MRLVINYRREKTLKSTNTWRLNNTLLKSQKVTEEIKKDIKEYPETSANENTATQNLWNESKTVMRGKYIKIQSYLKKQQQ